jgi:hypothetical protein
MFEGKARAYLSEASFRCPTLGLAPALAYKHLNRMENLIVTNTLAYYENSKITAVKSFITLGTFLSGLNSLICIINFFTAIDNATILLCCVFLFLTLSLV